MQPWRGRMIRLIRLSHQRSVGDEAVTRHLLFIPIGLLESRCVPLAKAFPRNLCAPGAPEGLCRFCGGHESGVSILRRHRRDRLDISQAASRGSGEYRRGGGLIVRELGNTQPIMVAEGQVPPDQPAADTLAEFGDGFLTIFRLSHHALDGI